MRPAGDPFLGTHARFGYDSFVGRNILAIGLALVLTGAANGSSCSSPAAYTFHMNATIVMRVFPWLHFRIGGDGQYVRGKTYVVHFTRMPFFAKGFQQIDLSPLEPSMWPKRYFVSIADSHDGMTMFALRPRKSDPQNRNQLAEAFVTLDATQATRSVDLRYTDGEIQINLTPGETQGYHLPAIIDANINMPGEVLAAHGEFTDYTIRNAGARPLAIGSNPRF